MASSNFSSKNHPRIVVLPPGPKAREVIRRDARVLSQATVHLYPIVVEKGERCIVKDIDGNEFIDFFSASATVNVGHNHPRVVEAIKSCLSDSFSFGYGSVYAQNMIRLAEVLVNITPSNAEKNVCYSCSGSEAVEVGMKAAAWHSRGRIFFAFRGSSHGRTIGALSISSAKIVHKRYLPKLDTVIRFPYPYCYRCSFGLIYPSCGLRCVSLIEDCLNKDVSAEEVAAFVFEPIQSEGCIVPPSDFYNKFSRLTKSHGVILLDDENLTGMGRTGRWFGIENWNVYPDILSIGSSLASGLPLGATIGRTEVMDWEPDLHGSTSGGNILVCTSALATLEAIREDHLLENASRQGNYSLRRLQEMAEGKPIVGDVRGKGLLIGIEIVKPETMEPDHEAALQILLKSWRRGLLLQNTSISTIRLCPPLNITRDLIDTSLDILETVFNEVATQT